MSTLFSQFATPIYKESFDFEVPEGSDTSDDSADATRDLTNTLES
jgi:hypothetical protein